MAITLNFKTNLNCQSCVASVKPHLDKEAAIDSWEVDTSSPDKTLTVSGEQDVEKAAKDAVARAGFLILGKVRTSSPEPAPEPTLTVTYYPLVLLIGFLLGVVALVEFRIGSFQWERAMQNFMGAFFLTFSFFKLLDIRGFASAFRMYDIVARRFSAYGYAYPFIELALGVFYFTGFQPVLTNLSTLVVMSVSSVGVIQSLLQHRKIKCACLGTVFNLPMSTVTLVEDAAMLAMAATMLFVETIHAV